MSFSAIFARLVALIGGAALLWRRLRETAPPEPAWGSAPAIPEAKPQGAIPTLIEIGAQKFRRMFAHR